MLFYLIFVILLIAGFVVSIVSGALFGFFCLIQVIIIFEQLLRYINQELPGCVLVGTAFMSMLHQLTHALSVFILTDISSRQ